ncbi:flagellar hook-length control protein FliK [Methylobacterium sp. J-090]|uniref:flagellar hook-length control protein FliK n=1 Tax=Methylobacterium sp. J-090 TaxID=2836666 RepID=UPI001FBAC059|nr:flagellar hook-length control protein FliK [Methylobacterium sp. J-090]MCJ2083926.1 flagellar hook-length control protein FliK [Methylobacterium sp. J-090]
MNTFAAMMPAPRPTDAVAPRGGTDAVEVSSEATAEAFGAVLGALKEGRPVRDAARRDGETADDAAASAGSAPAEPANSVLSLVVSADAGTIPPAAMDPAALLALIARAVPGAPAAPAPTASPAGQAASEQILPGRIASVPAGVAELAAGIVLAAGENGHARDGLQGLSAPGVPGQDIASQTVPAQGDIGPRAPVETRPQVTILQQETHFAPIKPRLVAGQAAAIPAMAGPADAAPPSVAPAPILPALPATAVAEAVPTRDVSSPLSAPPGIAASFGPASAAAAVQNQAPITQAQAAAALPPADAPVPPTGSLPVSAPTPESSGKPRRAESTPVSGETAAVASPSAQRIAGEAAPVEAARPSPGEGTTTEAGPHASLTPVATAPGGTLPSAAALGEPARQVAEAVAAELARPASTASAAAATPGTEGPLRLLTIQLRPMDLGTVLVRMRLRDGQLEMTLHASREETAALLRQDGTLLTDLLRSSGYQPDSVTIGASGQSQGEGGRPGSGAAFQPGAGGGQAQNGANPDQTSRREGEGAKDERSDPTSERIHETTSSGPDRSGLYL